MVTSGVRNPARRTEYVLIPWTGITMADHVPEEFLSINILTGQPKTSLRASYRISKMTIMDITYPDIPDEQNSYVTMRITMGNDTRHLEIFQGTWMDLFDRFDDISELYSPSVSANSEIYIDGFHIVKADDNLLYFTSTDKDDEHFDVADDKPSQNTRIRFGLSPSDLQRLDCVMDQIGERGIMEYLDLVYLISEE
jgi:hypothetical protein